MHVPNSDHCNQADPPKMIKLTEPKSDLESLFVHRIKWKVVIISFLFNKNEIIATFQISRMFTLEIILQFSGFSIYRYTFFDNATFFDLKTSYWPKKYLFH